MAYLFFIFFFYISFFFLFIEGKPWRTAVVWLWGLNPLGHSVFYSNKQRLFSVTFLLKSFALLFCSLKLHEIKL